MTKKYARSALIDENGQRIVVTVVSAIYLGESNDIDGNVGTEFCADLDVLVVILSLQEWFLKKAHYVVVCCLLCVLREGKGSSCQLYAVGVRLEGNEMLRFVVVVELQLLLKGEEGDVVCCVERSVYESESGNENESEGED